MMALNLLLLAAALILLLAWAIPPPPAECWLPASAPTRGVYADCWGFWEIWI